MSQLQTSLRLIQPELVSESVTLLNDFSMGLFQLSQRYKLTVNETKELYDKVTKGNEGLVSNFLNSDKQTLEKISDSINKEVVSFQLTLDPHGTDGYFLTKKDEAIPVELKTTGSKVKPINPAQRRKTNTNYNLVYKNSFKYHFTDGTQGLNYYFQKETDRCRNGQVTVFAGIYEIDGKKQIGDVFFLDQEQSIKCLEWGFNHRCDGNTLQVPATMLFDGGKLSPHVNHVFSDTEINSSGTGTP